VKLLRKERFGSENVVTVVIEKERYLPTPITQRVLAAKVAVAVRARASLTGSSPTFSIALTIPAFTLSKMRAEDALGDSALATHRLLKSPLDLHSRRLVVDLG